MPLAYLLAGCPALVANLWDVTDRDIDKFSTALIDSWVDGNLNLEEENHKENGDNGPVKSSSLASELPRAREACKLRFLNGASPVCYGVPVHMASRQPLKGRVNSY